MAYRRTERVEARLADNRTRILDAARQVVSQGGWAETQIASVAATAGLATGTVYRYFESKTELFVEILAEVSRQEMTVMNDVAARASSPHAGLHAAVQTFVKRAMGNRRLAYALIAEPCEPDLHAARLTYRHAVSELVRRLVTAGQGDGSFRRTPPADVAASVIVGGFTEALVGPLTPGSQSDAGRSADRVQQFAEDIADLCCACVAAIPSTSAASALARRKVP